MRFVLESKEDRAAYAARIRELRKERRYRMWECAEALGVAVATYSDMEGNNTRFRRRDLVTLATLYGLSLEEAYSEVPQAA